MIRQAAKSCSTALVLLVCSVGVWAQSTVPDNPTVSPYEGAWVTGEGKLTYLNWVQPGSGLMMDQQGDTLVVALFTYNEKGAPVWYLASGPIKAGNFDQPAYKYADGSYFTCMHRTPVASEAFDLRLMFIAKTLAYMQIGDSAPIPIRVLPSGSFWTRVMPEREKLGQHGEPVIWDAAGRWVLVEINDRSGFEQQLDLVYGPILDPGGANVHKDVDVFENGLFYGCYAPFRNETAHSTCTLDRQQEDSLIALFSAFWGDQTPESVTGYVGPPNTDSSNIRGNRVVRMFRLTASPQRNVPFFESRALPIESGAWIVPGEPGSGFFLIRQNQTLFFTIYTYNAEGEAIWYQGSGEIEAARVETKAYRFFDGSCFRCVYEGAPNPGEGVSVVFEFDSYTTAHLTFGDNETIRIEALAFDSPKYKTFGESGTFGQPHLYDLSGEWLFVSPKGMERYFERVRFTGLKVFNDGKTVSWKNTVGTKSFRCDARPEFESPQCRYIIFDGDRWHRRFSAHFADVGEDRIVGYEEAPFSGGDGPTRGERLIYGFRLSGPLKANR